MQRRTVTSMLLTERLLDVRGQTVYSIEASWTHPAVNTVYDTHRFEPYLVHSLLRTTRNSGAPFKYSFLLVQQLYE